MADRDRLSRALSEAVSRAVSDALDMTFTANGKRLADVCRLPFAVLSSCAKASRTPGKDWQLVNKPELQHKETWRPNGECFMKTRNKL